MHLLVKYTLDLPFFAIQCIWLQAVLLGRLVLVGWKQADFSML